MVSKTSLYNPPHMKVRDIPTPALCVDIDVLEHNVDTMAAYFRDSTTSLRPHFKAHKTIAIANLQAAAGCGGFTCATVSEAEVLASAGFSDILIANQVLDPAKVERVRSLADRVLLTVAFDSAEGVELLRDIPVGALVDVNVGMPRCGVPPEGALDLARAIADTELQLRGVMGYEGHVVGIEEREARRGKAHESMQVLLAVAGELRDAGFEVAVVSGGGTGTYDITGATPGVTEVQAGSYALMDTAYAKLGLPFEEALRCLATVVSVQGRLAVLDGGLKALAVDHGNPSLEEGVPARVLYLADEHTTLVTDEGFAARPGSRLRLRPSHVDPTVNLHDSLYAVRADEVVDVWSVGARGYRGTTVLGTPA